MDSNPPCDNQHMLQIPASCQECRRLNGSESESLSAFVRVLFKTGTGMCGDSWGTALQRNWVHGKGRTSMCLRHLPYSSCKVSGSKKGPSVSRHPQVCSLLRNHF